MALKFRKKRKSMKRDPPESYALGDAALDDAWVEEMVELITERWPST